MKTNMVGDLGYTHPGTTVKQGAQMSNTLAVSSADFKEKVLDSPIPVLVDFWASWCGPCRMIAPDLEKLAEEYAGKVSIVKLNVEGEEGLAAEYGVMNIPLLLIFKGGKVVDKHVGAAPKATLAAFIQRNL